MNAILDCYTNVLKFKNEEEEEEDGKKKANGMYEVSIEHQMDVQKVFNRENVSEILTFFG